MTATATRPTTATDIVIKQYRISGRCVLRSGGHDIAGLYDAIGRISTRTHGDSLQAQEAVIATTLGDHGYALSTMDRDDYGNWLLTFAQGPKMRAGNAQYWG